MKNGSTLKPKDYKLHQKTDKKSRSLKEINLQGTFLCNCGKTEDECVFWSVQFFLTRFFFCKISEEALQGLMSALP